MRRASIIDPELGWAMLKAEQCMRNRRKPNAKVRNKTRPLSGAAVHCCCHRYCHSSIQPSPGTHTSCPSEAIVKQISMWKSWEYLPLLAEQLLPYAFLWDTTNGGSGVTLGLFFDSE